MAMAKTAVKTQASSIHTTKIKLRLLPSTGFIAAGGASAAFIYNRMNAFNDAIHPRPL